MPRYTWDTAEGGLMKRRIATALVILMTLFTLMPSLTWAAGGGGGTEIVVVADTRVVHNPVLKYFADIYNSNILVFAVWCVVLTAVYGVALGFLMDWIMSKTGLDLKSRKIVEH
jgi:ABC-type Fe3+ transport system permease subunit